MAVEPLVNSNMYSLTIVLSVGVAKVSVRPVTVPHTWKVFGAISQGGAAGAVIHHRHLVSLRVPSCDVARRDGVRRRCGEHRVALALQGCVRLLQ